MQFLESLTKTLRRIMNGIPKKCTRPPRIPSVVIRERAVTPNWLLGCTENGFPWQMRWCGPGSDGWGFGLVVSGLLDAGYLLSHSSSSGTSTYTGSAPHTHTDVILHMESWITIACPQCVCTDMLLWSVEQFSGCAFVHFYVSVNLKL